MSARAETIHATCVAIEGRAVLLRGASGAGKSDLALRLVDEGADLVADDRVRLALRGGRLVASPPRTLEGLLEVRGLGIVRLPFLAGVHVTLVADLVPAADILRLPTPGEVRLCGVALPCIALDPSAPSATARVRLALAGRHWVAGALGDEDGP
ncbi:HPr kinase/phosphorylase [Futiania mangrovi]|uniref:HPr kinase/phosphatase C-terminal domain-containing protein n=1 Tax=Futiania mangrovi TaxID=2959716 RepID=A0A9J6PHF7_9PROT|nr:HPr kinase/phosphatase C-terminal domain-containing protein [Futiania mangrovii]MCP1337235.1 HPr kinase/phosphatase C-terminal domain-containing protein [Futiania mangrovii]